MAPQTPMDNKSDIYGWLWMSLVLFFIGRFDSGVCSTNGADRFETWQGRVIKFPTNGDFAENVKFTYGDFEENVKFAYGDFEENVL